MLSQSARVGLFKDFFEMRREFADDFIDTVDRDTIKGQVIQNDLPPIWHCASQS